MNVAKYLIQLYTIILVLGYPSDLMWHSCVQCSTDLDLQNDVLASRGPGAGICTLGITCKDGKLHEGTAAKIHCIGTAHAKTLRKNS